MDPVHKSTHKLDQRWHRLCDYAEKRKEISLIFNFWESHRA
jgi:hypothetical protein